MSGDRATTACGEACTRFSSCNVIRVHRQHIFFPEKRRRHDEFNKLGAENLTRNCYNQDAKLVEGKRRKIKGSLGDSRVWQNTRKCNNSMKTNNMAVSRNSLLLLAHRRSW